MRVNCPWLLLAAARSVTDGEIRDPRSRPPANERPSGFSHLRVTSGQLSTDGRCHRVRADLSRCSPVPPSSAHFEPATHHPGPCPSPCLVVPQFGRQLILPSIAAFHRSSKPDRFCLAIVKAIILLSCNSRRRGKEKDCSVTPWTASRTYCNYLFLIPLLLSFPPPHACPRGRVTPAHLLPGEAHHFTHHPLDRIYLKYRFRHFFLALNVHSHRNG